MRNHHRLAERRQTRHAVVGQQGDESRERWTHRIAIRIEGGVVTGSHHARVLEGMVMALGGRHGVEVPKRAEDMRCRSASRCSTEVEKTVGSIEISMEVCRPQSHEHGRRHPLEREHEHEQPDDGSPKDE